MKTNLQFETEERIESHPQLTIVELRQGLSILETPGANFSKSSRSVRPELESLSWPVRSQRLARNGK